MNPIRVLVVEDEGLYREILTIALQSVPEIEVVGSAPDDGAALALAQEHKPDVVLMDIELGGNRNGIEVGRLIRRDLPRTGIVLLSNHRVRHCLQAIPPAEAAGWSYLLKRSVTDLNTLVRAVQGAALGLVVLDPQLNEDLMPRQGSRLSGLTPRQLEILRLVAEGYSNAAIASKLSLAYKSVENYLTSIYQELRIWQEDEPTHPRVKAILIYLEEMQPTISTRPG